METSETMSDRVARNVRRLRTDDDLTLRSLSDRLKALGHPIGITTLSKLERGDRGVDVDDLVALARALGTSESYLLSDPQAQISAEAMALMEGWRRARRERIDGLRRLDRQVESTWQILVDYASQSSAKQVAVEQLLAHQFGDDEVGVPMGAAAVQQLRNDIDGMTD